ncbi:unnamed protein product [Sphagnum balticum]
MLVAAPWLTIVPLDRGEKPFQCSYCLVQFCRKDLLKRHVTRLHPHEAGNPKPPNAPQDSQLDSTQQVADVNFDSILSWDPVPHDAAAVHCQSSTAILFDITNTVNMDMGNLMSDFYYGDSALEFHNIDLLATPPSTSQMERRDSAKSQSTAELQWNNYTQLTPATTTDECNETPQMPAPGTFDVSESKRNELIAAIRKVGSRTLAHERSVGAGC